VLLLLDFARYAGGARRGCVELLMIPVTSFLSCTESIDELNCFLTRQKHHVKTVQSISNIVLPVKNERALNKFLTEYDWDENQLNKEWLELLQEADDTNKTGKQIPNAGKFFRPHCPRLHLGTESRLRTRRR